ncbi:MAG: LuxR C-terminal-related transcriptional regulator [Candidatus Zixiibacteriota bacterium]
MGTVTIKKNASRMTVDDILSVQSTNTLYSPENITETMAKNAYKFLSELPACIIGITSDLNVVFWNAHCEQIMGYSSDEMCDQSKPLHRLCPDWEKSEAILHSWRQRHFVFTDFETEFKSKGGDIKYFRWSSLPKADTLPKDRHFMIGVDMTAQRKAEQNLQMAARHLVIEREALQEKNQTLQELLGQINEEKERLAVFLRSNIEAFVLPMFERLKARADQNESEYIGLIESSLKAVIGEIGLSHKEFFNSLTPREIEICQMVKGGFSSKEIGGFINCSEATVRQHRRNIRKKLGIKRKRVNLATYLQAGGIVERNGR